MIEAICQNYGCLPSQALAEPAWIWRHMTIIGMTRRAAYEPDGDPAVLHGSRTGDWLEF